VEDVAAGVGAAAAAAVAAPDTVGVLAIVEEATALVTALRGVVVLLQLVDAATAGRRNTTATNIGYNGDNDACTGDLKCLILVLCENLLLFLADNKKFRTVVS